MKKEKTDPLAQKYTEYMVSLPIEKGTVFYHAYRTRIMAGNPYAIFKYLMDHDEYSHLQHVWVYTEDEQLKYDTFQRYANYDNVTLVKANSDEHLRALATCEYFVENAALPAFWQKREGQIYVNTWHGTPLKSLGKTAIDSSKAAISNAQRNFLMCDYFVMPNRYTIEKMLYSYDLEHLMHGTILDAGYPRNDLVLSTNRERIRGLLEKKCGKSLSEKKIILYAPTFRSKEGKSLDTSDEVIGYIEAIVQRLPEEYEIFFKIHNTLGKFFKDNQRISNNLIFDEIETNELLSATDILITDYSSIFFDFLCTRRPILFFVYDREEYETEHGIYLSMDDMPGALCYTVDDLLAEISKIQQGIYSCSNYEKNVSRFAYHDDGEASKRVCEAVFGNKNCEFTYTDSQLPRKRNILLSISDEATASEQMLLEHVLREFDYDECSVTVCTNGIDKIYKMCEQINPDIRIFASKIVFNYTKEEEASGASSPEFLIRQEKKYFPEFPYDEYYNLKTEESAIDLIVSGHEKINNSWFMNAWRDMGAALRDSVLEYSQIKVFAYDTREVREYVSEDIPGKQFEIVQKQDISDSPNHRMTVLCVAAFDSMNYTLAACVKELKARGHRVIVVAARTDDRLNNRIFESYDIQLMGYDTFDNGTLNYVDIIIGAPVKYGFSRLYRGAIRRNIMLFSFSVLFSSIVMRNYPDIVFCIGESKFDEFRSNYLDYNCIAVGNPQYDAIVTTRSDDSIEADDVKKVLVIDQGGYPYGSKGKQQLADTLVRIARMNPGMVFDIKPRYVPGERGETTHAVSEHLFDYLKEIPDNLNPMMYPTILEDIIVDYDAMITTWSTAYLDALVRDMPLILIGGLDSVDTFDVRRQRVASAYETLSRTGCLYDYRELGDLTGKFHRIDPAFVREEVYGCGSSSADRICNVIEKVYSELVQQGKRFDDSFMVPYHQFADEMDTYRTIDINGDDDRYKYTFRTRYESGYNARMQEYVYINRCMGGLMDLSPLFVFREPDMSEYKPGLTYHEEGEIIEKLLMTMELKYNEIVREFFERAEMSGILKDDRILQDFYADWLFETKQYQKLKSIPDDYLIPDTLEYYRGRMELSWNKPAAYRHLFNYLNIIKGHEVTQLLKERRIAKTLGPFRDGLNKLWFYYYTLRFNEFDSIEMMRDVTTERNGILTYFKLRHLNDIGDAERAEKVYNDYIKIYNKQKKKRKRSLPGRLKFMRKTMMNKYIESEHKKTNKH